MKVNATEFKAKCLKLVDEVARTREPIIVTKRGRPVAKVVPIEPETPPFYFGYMAGTIKIIGDIISPIQEPWSAITGDEDEFYKRIGVAEDQEERQK